MEWAGLIGDTMGKKDILKTLRNYKKDVAEQYNILTIGIFGSVARDEAGEDSDVDVVVRISEPDLFMLVGIKKIWKKGFADRWTLLHTGTR